MQFVQKIIKPDPSFSGKYFGFFQPYTEFKGSLGLGSDLKKAILGPLALGLATGLATIGIVLGAITAASSLLIASVASLAGLFTEDAKQKANIVFMITARAASITAACACFIIVAVLLLPLATSISIARLVTRGGATAVSAVSNCFAKLENQIQEDEEDGFSKSFDPVY